LIEKIKHYIFNYKILLIICLIIIFIIGGIFLYYNEQNKENILINNIKEDLVLKEEIKPTYELIYVDIKGAVKNPGVYEMKSGDLIIDVINKAGGLLETSDTSITNLAYKINDELSFKIYTKKEVIEIYKKKVITESCICPTITNNTCVIDKLTNIEEETTSLKISINTASKDSLITLNGIGDATANKIILYREENGNFLSIEDIMKVSGIGESLFAKIKDFITI
jgi:competence protein ComEA